MGHIAFDPFVVPNTVPICKMRPRARDAVEGAVTELRVRHWAGGTAALHVTIADLSGSFTGVFLGRTRLAGIELGERVVLAGTAVQRRGVLLFMNPHLWLSAAEPIVTGRGCRPALIHA